MTMPKAKVAKDAPSPVTLTDEDHARIDEESVAIVKELDERFRKMERLPTEPIIMGNPFVVFGPQESAEYKPELRFRKLTDEEIEHVREEVREMQKIIDERFCPIKHLPPEKLRMRVR